MKLKEVFEKSVQYFKDKKIESARLDAEILIASALKIERLQIYLKYEQPLSEAEIQACRELVRRRGLGEPVAYLTYEKGFYGEIFSVGEGVLIPRPETEQIVEEALKFIKENNLTEPYILDIGAGTGCIGFSILKNCTGAKLVSIEKSEAAFKYLKQNQEQLQLTERSQLHLADALNLNLENIKFDIIVANPPYISEADPQTEIFVKKYEPASALFSMQNGYADIFSWSDKYKKHLNKPGVMLFEMGHLQGEKSLLHFKNLNQFTEVKILKDLSGLDRIIKSSQ